MTTEVSEQITSHAVPKEQAGNFLYQRLGRACLRGESLIFDWARNLSSDYHGGQWLFFSLSNGGFYAVPDRDDQMTVVVSTNGYEGTMSPDAFGLTVTLFALCQLAELTQSDQIIEHFHAVRAFAMNHEEQRKIFRAID